MKGSSFFVGKVLIALCLVLVFAGPSVVYGAAAEPIKVGVVLSITGWGGFIGTPVKEAMTVIVDDFNKRGGVQGRQVELYFEDDKSIPTNAVIATTKLVRDMKVSVLTGPSITDSAMAMIPIVEREQRPFVLLGPAVNPFKKWVFNVTPNEFVNAGAVLEYAVRELGAKRIAVMHDVQNLGKMGMKAIEGDLPKYPGISIVITGEFEASDTSVIPQLTNIKAANPDVILLETSGGETAGVIAKNYRQLGMKTPVVTCPAVATREFLKVGGSAAEDGNWLLLTGKAMVADKLPSDDPWQRIYEPLKKLMKEKYGESKQLTLFHHSGHDAIQVVLEALKIARSDDPGAIRNALETLKFDGLLGPYACTSTDHRGVQIFNGVVSVVRNGEFVPYTKKGGK